MSGTSPPGDPAGTTRNGPWTEVRSGVTASCTRCGAAPLDEATGLTPHFDSAGQARGELARDWGWRCTARSGWPEDDDLLCPACAKAHNDDGPRVPAVSTDGSLGPATAPRREEPGLAPRPQLPANARVPPAPRRTREEG